MSADITAFLQIDENTPGDQPPFTNDPSTWDLSHDHGLSAGKHYEFYAALCGVRNESGISPLYPCRGLPPTGSRELRRRFDADDPNVSWLTLSEVHRALQHMKIGVETLKRPIQLLLRTMQTAEELYGRDRVRLVFQVSD